MKHKHPKTAVTVAKKTGATRPPRKADTMPNEMTRDWHDPESDMHTLKRAEEIKGDGRRHGAAVHAAKSHMTFLKNIAGMKVHTK